MVRRVQEGSGDKAPPEGLKTLNVLLADDEPDVVTLLRATLADDPRIDLLLAFDGDEAWRICVTEKSDLVFLDVMMPRRDGLSVCQAIKQDPQTSHITVVMLSALAQGADVQRAMRAGADDYITKPFSPTALLNKVHSVLGLVPKKF